MIACIIQARLGSERLPKKILEEVAPNVTLLQQVIRRVKKSKYVDKIVVALANDSKEVIPMVEAEGVEYSWYPLQGRNLLAEYVNAASKVNADIIVRIAADCPFIDPLTIDQMISVFIPSEKDLAYNHNDNYTGFGVEIDGVDVEVFTRNALLKAYSSTLVAYDLEHCTPWMYKNLKTMRVEQCWTDEILPEWVGNGQVKLSVNTPEQLERVRKIISVLGTDFHTKTLTEYLSKNKP